jgi:hypothetical protein
MMTSTRAIALPLALGQTLSFASMLAAQSPPTPQTQDSRPQEVTLFLFDCGPLERCRREFGWNLLAWPPVG